MIDAKSYPLDDTNYIAGDLRKWNFVFSTGILPVDSHFKTTTNNDMSITVTKGNALFNLEDEGLVVWTDVDDILTLDTAHGTLDRIDAITLRYDYTENRSWIYVKKGTASSTPTAPIPTRDNSAYEIVVAHINVPKGSTSISSGNITDKRQDTYLCGYIKSRAESIPTDMITAQFEELIEQYRQAVEDIGSLTVPDGAITEEKLNTTLKNRMIFFVSDNGDGTITVEIPE